jgi:hypothetical protein
MPLSSSSHACKTPPVEGAGADSLPGAKKKNRKKTACSKQHVTIEKGVMILFMKRISGASIQKGGAPIPKQEGRTGGG